MARASGRQARGARLATWFTLALVVALSTEIGLAFSQSPAASPGQILQEALTAAGRTDAFHYRAVWRADGVSQVIDGDARPASGSESVVVGGDRFSVVFTGRVVYFEGNADAVRDQLGLQPAKASIFAGRWVSIDESDSPFPSVEEGLTTSAALAQVLIAPSSDAPLRRPNGLEISRITGHVPHGRHLTGSARLDLVARSRLPVEYVAGGSLGGQPWSSTIAFSRWGDDSGVTAPAGALPFASLDGSVFGSKGHAS